MDNCVMCKKRAAKLTFNMFANNTKDDVNICNRTLSICYECLYGIFSSIINIIDSERSGKIFKCKRKHISSNKEKDNLTKDDVIDINLWIKKLKNGNDFIGGSDGK